MERLKMMFLKFIVSNWKNILVGILSALLLYIVLDWNTQRERISQLEDEIVECSQDKNEALARLRLIEQSLTEQATRIKLAERQRAEIAQKYAQALNTIRTQEIPKQCDAAINWAIENKGDLSW